jgi:hypothetical protein
MHPAKVVRKTVGEYDVRACLSPFTDSRRAHAGSGSANATLHHNLRALGGTPLGSHCPSLAAPVGIRRRVA